MVAVISASSTEFYPGDVIDGRYRILRKLADGGMGTVFLATHMLIRRRVAIKLLHAELASDQWMVRRFLNEAAAAGTLGHPHIVESTDMGFTRDGIPYIVFEYLEGCLLTEEIRRIGTLPVRHALVIARQIASALEAVHHAQIAHLDLKGDNVFLTQRGNALIHAKLIDFGISRFMASEFERTPPGILMGTPEFMAPEQVIDAARADHRADIYALGVVLYEMLAGRCPFEGDDLRQVLRQVVDEPPPALGRAVPPALEHLLFSGLLVKSRDDRIQTMAEVTMVLDALLSAMRADVPRTVDERHHGGAPREPSWEVEIVLDDPSPFEQRVAELDLPS
ncbi:MAG TPA: serine/threonine-protein kinase [Kofleriaceae bacterium]